VLEQPRALALGLGGQLDRALAAAAACEQLIALRDRRREG
jgi:hypothetical protein